MDSPYLERTLSPIINNPVIKPVKTPVVDRPATATEINSIYQQSFGRPPTTEELSTQIKNGVGIKNLTSWANKNKISPNTPLAVQIPTGGANGAINTPVPVADRVATPQEITALYQKNFGRAPTADELTQHATNETGINDLTQWADKNRTQITDLGDLARRSAAAGLSFSDYLKIAEGNAGVSKEEAQKIKDDLGITALEASVFEKPKQSTQEIYNQAYTQAGLANIKKQYEDLNTKINTKRDQLNQSTGVINENPWLTEASRVGRVKRLQDLAQNDINNLVNQQNQLKDLYNTGISEVNNLVSRVTGDFTNNKQIDAAKLNYLEKKADESITQLGKEKTQKAYRYLPDYLKAKAEKNAKAPETVGSAEMGYYSYNSKTGKFEQVIAPKVKTREAPTSYQEWVLAGKPGTYAIWLKKGTSGDSEKNEKILTAVREDIAAYPKMKDATGQLFTREQYIRMLQGKYPQVEPQDIQDAVYKSYPDNWDAQ